MRKYYLLIILSIILVTPAHALFGLITKDDIQLLKAQIKQMEVGINANFKAQVGLINKTITKTINQRNTTSNSNSVVISLIISNMVTFVMFIVAIMRALDYRRSYKDFKAMNGNGGKK